MPSPSLLRASLLALLLGGAGCLYPDNYTFDETGGGGSGGTGNQGGGGSGNQGGGGSGNQGGGGSGNQGGGGTGGSTGGSGGSTGGTGGTGGSTGGSGGTGGMIPTTETNCFDNVDEDQDGDTDCQDTDCAPFAKCMPNKPANWEGPVILYEGSQAQNPSCPAEYPTDAYLLNAGPMGSGSCSPCTCGNPTGMTCSWPQNSGGVLTNEPYTSSLPCANGNSGCIGELSVPPNWTGACLGAGAPTGINTGWPPDVTCDAVGNCTGGAQGCNISLRSAAVSVTGGSCAASGGTLSKGPVTWSTTGHACADPNLAGGGCAMSQKCTPIPPAPFLSAACIYHLGDTACPAGQYDDKHVLYQNFLDSRACSACSCGAPFGASCSATITAYGSDGCSSNVLGSFPAGSCLDTPGNPTVDAWSATVIPPSGGLCSAAGGTFSGTVSPDPAQAVTFCCAAL